jgi:hypothetical protein
MCRRGMAFFRTSRDRTCLADWGRFICTDICLFVVFIYFTASVICSCHTAFICRLNLSLLFVAFICRIDLSYRSRKSCRPPARVQCRCGKRPAWRRSRLTQTRSLFSLVDFSLVYDFHACRARRNHSTNILTTGVGQVRYLVQ